jgi:mRNA interferase MazF
VPPDVGDIHWAELDGFRGTEQGGRRPVLIVSERFYNVRSNRVIVCPVSSRARGWKTEVALPGGFALSGVILTDQIRALDRAARLFDFIAVLPAPELQTVRHVLGLLLGIAVAPAAGQSGTSR